MAISIFNNGLPAMDRVSYLGRDEVLEVRFGNGSIYRFYHVPQRIWAILQLYLEGSAGSFLFTYIKNQFRSEKVKAGKDEVE